MQKARTRDLPDGRLWIEVPYHAWGILCQKLPIGDGVYPCGGCSFILDRRSSILDEVYLTLKDMGIAVEQR